jgi:hypothetical protein
MWSVPMEPGFMGLIGWQAFVKASTTSFESPSPARLAFDAAQKEVYHVKECDKRSWVGLERQHVWVELDQ